MDIFPGPSPEASHCPSHHPAHYLSSAHCFFFFPRPSYIFIQCPSPKAVQGVMFEMSSNKASANILSISKTAETRWICCVICSWLLRLLCWKWGKKLQSTEFQHYLSIHGEVNSCHVTSDSGVTHEHARRIFA